MGVRGGGEWGVGVCVCGGGGGGKREGEGCLPPHPSYVPLIFT